MLLLLLVIGIYVSLINGCSIALPPYGNYGIVKVELLDETSYPNSVLLTIYRSTQNPPSNINSSRLIFDDPSGGPWCKIMNVNNGLVGDVVDCDHFTDSIRDFATGDIDTTNTTVTCQDNCDGSTAACNIIRNGNLYNVNVSFLASDTSCAITTDDIFIAFTINDITTTYINFATNMVGLVFDEDVLNVINVDREGGEGDWDYYLTPGSFAPDNNPIMYSDVNVIQNALPCCVCYSWKLNWYTIESDPTGVYDQVFTLNKLNWSEFGGGFIDIIKSRGYHWGLGFSTAVTIYDLSNGSSVKHQPDLCDVVVNCIVDPCLSSSCPQNPYATCIADYCGGCNARWYVFFFFMFFIFCDL